MGILGDSLKKQAYKAVNAGRLHEASGLFARLLEREPDSHVYHYMRGLVHKYLRDWPASLHHNQRAIALSGKPDEASLWNAGIAATALGNWVEARRCWKTCGIDIPEGDGPVDVDWGNVCVRINAWGAGETLWAHRIDVVRGRLLNVPVPDSGYRFGDIVLHDGASTGKRRSGNREVPVFNALQLLERSEFKTHAAFVTCETEADAKALDDASGPGIGCIEDFGTMRYFCLRCSYGVPHEHGDSAKKDAGDEAWNPDRQFGIAAQSRLAVEKLLEDWRRASPHTRAIEAIEHADAEPCPPEDGRMWWRAPDDED